MTVSFFSIINNRIHGMNVLLNAVSWLNSVRERGVDKVKSFEAGRGRRRGVVGV